MDEEPDTIFMWHVFTCYPYEPAFWLVMVKKIPPMVLWERMKHKAVEIHYLDPRRGYWGDWDIYIDHYDPICEEQGNYLWSYKVYNKDLAEEFKEELKWTEEYKDKPYLITRNDNVLFIEEGGKLILLEPYKEYQIERLIKEPKVNKNYNQFLLVRDLSNGTKLMCDMESVPGSQKREVMKKAYDKLCEYTEEPHIIMMFLLEYLMRAYPSRPDFIAYFYEKYKKVEPREITEEELPDWYYRDEKNALVQRPPKMKEYALHGVVWREMDSPFYPGEYEGDVYLVRRLFDFGGDIIETRKYVINHSSQLRKTRRNKRLYTYYLYINGVGIENHLSLSTAPIKL
ncbi:MAG: hypothetical protein ACTSPV_05660 [Candidatus Hodarchaeales archaeon]